MAYTLLPPSSLAARQQFNASAWRGTPLPRWLASCMLTFCGASGCVVALRLPDVQLGRKGLCLLLVLAPQLLGSCDSVGSAELLAWLLLSNVEARPLHIENGTAAVEVSRDIQWACGSAQQDGDQPAHDHHRQQDADCLG